MMMMMMMMMTVIYRYSTLPSRLTALLSPVILVYILEILVDFICLVSTSMTGDFCCSWSDLRSKNRNPSRFTITYSSD